MEGDLQWFRLFKLILRVEVEVEVEVVCVWRCEMMGLLGSPGIHDNG
jgi:hypothetical protein